jgi:hypothetical protein
MFKLSLMLPQSIYDLFPGYRASGYSAFLGSNGFARGSEFETGSFSNI